MLGLRLAVLGAVALAAPTKNLPNREACSGIGGTFIIDLPNVYSEGGDFDPGTCSIFIGSTYNGSLVLYDPSLDTSTSFNFSSISGNDEFLVAGIEYGKVTGAIYVAAGARQTFYSGGAILSGPTRLIKFDPSTQEVIWNIDLEPTISKIQNDFDYSFGGFQDQAEDTSGNVYFMATWGNVLLKIDTRGDVSPFYIPPPELRDNTLPGFGGIVTFGDKLLVTDILSGSLLSFDLESGGDPVNVRPTNLPSGFMPMMCDSLYIPPRYSGEVALCADAWVQGRGGVVAYRSEDDWDSATYVGLVLNPFPEAPNSTITATFEAAGAIYAVPAYPPNPETGESVEPESFPIIDITERIDALL